MSGADLKHTGIIIIIISQDLIKDQKLSRIISTAKRRTISKNPMAYHLANVIW